MREVLELGVCPVCTSRQFTELANRLDITRQLEDLWTFHTRRLKPGAPVSQLFDRAIFSQRPPVHLVRCTACGTVLRNPREADDAIVETYAEEEAPTGALDDLFREQVRFYTPRVRRLERLLGRTGSVLEVGSYVGAFLHAAQQRGWQAHGTDVNEQTNRFARGRGCTVTTGALEDAPVTRYDVVALWNCVDQLPDPAATLLHARARLDRHGIVALRIPNGAFYEAARRLPFGAALLAHNNLLGFPYRHGFTPTSIRRLLEAADFRIAVLRGDTLVSTAGDWTRGWADLEARAIKGITRLLTPRRFAPWIEVYARAV